MAMMTALWPLWLGMRSLGKRKCMRGLGGLISQQLRAVTHLSTTAFSLSVATFIMMRSCGAATPMQVRASASHIVIGVRCEWAPGRCSGGHAKVGRTLYQRRYTHYKSMFLADEPP